MVLRRVFLEDYCLILPFLTLRGRSHLEDKDMEMLGLLVLLGRDHSSNSILLHMILDHLTLHLMHSTSHQLCRAPEPDPTVNRIRRRGPHEIIC